MERITLIIISLTLFVACQNKSAESSIIESKSAPNSETNQNNLKSNGQVSFQLNGKLWISSDKHPDTEFDVKVITDHKTLIDIRAYAKDGSYLAMTIYNEEGISERIYNISDVGMRGFYRNQFVDGISYLSNGMKENLGTITIGTLTQTEVSGTFEFPLRSSVDPDDIIEIEAGNFNMAFSKF